MLPYAHFIGNETRVICGKIQDRYAWGVSYEYMLIYRTVVNTFQIVMTNAHDYVTTIFHDSMHALNISFHITLVILFRHLIGVNCISYMAQDQMLQVRYLLIYTAAIFLNTIHMIGQYLTTFTKPCTYGE